ncbi:MAG: flavin-binding protein [Phycisphaerales bacterium]|nr:MAG: flavin-binding protein [Phycisphaerales bacterium]
MEAPTLPDVLTDLWRRLERGATERRHPYHQPVVSSMGEDASPRSRTVVLRNADRDGASLVFHTDARSPKCAELRANTALTWTFYDPASKVQLRVRSRAEVLTTGEIVDQRWANTRAMGRRCYLAPRTPGVSVGDQPDPNLPEALRHREPTEQESKPGRANFAVVRCAIESVDWLHLRHDGHRRAQFVFRDRKPDGGAWLAP